MYAVSQVDEQWGRLSRLNQKSAKMMRFMGKYFIFVLNDEEVGNKLIAQARNAQRERNKMVDNLDDISNDAIPLIVALTESDKLGIIYNANKAMCSLVGYTKTDLMNRKINILQPDMFSKMHDLVLEQYLERTVEYVPQVRERHVFVKNKANYIMPC